MIELTREQGETIASDHESPPIAFDPLTRTTYVLMKQDQYTRLQNFADDDARRLAPLLADIDPEDWEDASAYEGKS